MPVRSVSNGSRHLLSWQRCDANVIPDVITYNAAISACEKCEQSRYQYVVRYRTPEWHEAVDSDFLRLLLRLRVDRGGIENTRSDIMPGAMPQGGSLGREQNTSTDLSSDIMPGAMPQGGSLGREHYRIACRHYARGNARM